jgi:hypothetical protein
MEVKRDMMPVSEKPYAIIFDRWPLDALPPAMQTAPNGDLLDVDVVLEKPGRASLLFVSRRDGGDHATSACLLADIPTMRALSELILQAADALERGESFTRCTYATWEATIAVSSGRA